MHFGWALLLWLNARVLGNRWITALFTALLVLNFVATMAMGETTSSISSSPFRSSSRYRRS